MQCLPANEPPHVLEQLVLFKKKGLIEALIRKSLDTQIES
jgi:hypothetical protein